MYWPTHGPTLRTVTEWCLPNFAERLRMFRTICERHAVPPRAVALQFPIAHPAVATVVVGARSPDEVADNIGLFSHLIPHAVWTDLKTAGLLAAGAPTP